MCFRCYNKELFDNAQSRGGVCDLDRAWGREQECRPFHMRRSLMKDKLGYTLTEMLVVLVITGIIVLMVGALGGLAYKSYNRLRNVSGAYNDSQWGLQLIREGVRQSISNPTFASNCLTLVTPNGTTNVYLDATRTNLHYNTTPGGCGTSTSPPIIKGVTNLVFTPNVNNLPQVAVTLTGTKAFADGTKAQFAYSMSATRRNP